MKFFSPILIIFFSFLLQGAILGRWPSFFILPNLILVALIFICLIYDRKESLVAALFAGLLVDFFSGLLFGVISLCFLAIALILSEAKFYLFAKINLIISLSSIIAGTIFYYCLTFSFLAIFYFLKLSNAYSPINFKGIFLEIMPGEILGNVIVGVIFYGLIKIIKNPRYSLRQKKWT